MTGPGDRPVITVGAIIERADGKLLLVRTHKWRGRWGLPGGKVDRGETLEDALRRELREETGLEIHDMTFVIAQESIDSPEFYKPAHMLLMNYHCRSEGSDVRLNDEAQEYLWAVPEAALGLELSTPTRTLIERWLEKGLSSA
jgi:phosphoglycolate phosphatase